MEKTSIEMDLGEWEFLPESKSFLGFGHEGGKDLFPKEIRIDTKGIVDMNYFICPSPTSPCIRAEEEKSNTATETKKALPPPIVPEPVANKKPDDEVAREFKDIGVVPPVIVASHDAAAVSQVFFKVKENEFVDMKMNSPKSNTKGIIPHIEPDPIRFDEQGEEEMEKDEDHLESEVKGKPCWESFGFNIWRWRLAGIGALCSIGVAAATICIFILGGRQRQKQQHQNQRIQFQIYADDQRIKQMVQQATRLNHALSAARGGPMTRAQNVAHISFGGYYNGL
ncbi:uncharacterized protein [Elaeis guineensis]|uniref:Uncharacterized protein LOC105054819 n=1 Tax=Elaeis guineensis var. tenera TaxID=51953 RepID=A0A6J0PG37_ELAGV|nr:uncharacterized protein LOC105054819 [Elaeis guineensis]XP_029123678.1 uncharacterized protein LOC105054819 [Elaeis guineensis]